MHPVPVELDPLTEAIVALARHDATCASCEAALPEAECEERARLKVTWRKAVREGARMVASTPVHSPPCQTP